MEKEIVVKRFGVGSFSLLISIFSAAFSCTYIKGKSIGEYVLGTLGMSFPPGLISIILFCLSIYIGHKYRQHKYARAGMILAIAFFVLFFISIIITMMVTIL